MKRQLNNFKGNVTSIFQKWVISKLRKNIVARLRANGMTVGKINEVLNYLGQKQITTMTTYWSKDGRRRLEHYEFNYVEPFKQKIWGPGGKLKGFKEVKILEDPIVIEE